MSFNDDEEIVIPKGPKPIVPGRIQLDIRNNANAPITGINQKVLLQLTGTGEGRAGLDLVAVLDVSGSMGEDDKIGKMKLALQFMMTKLTPLDRLSIVKYSTKAMRVCKLTQMTEKSQTELANLIEGLKATGSTNITDGLTMGLNVLNGRTIRDGRVGVIMLMTDGQENKSSDASKVKCNVTVHTFGFGDGQDSQRLMDIAKNSPNGGTYSEVRLENLNLAFSQCLAGLLSVVAQELTVTIEQEGSIIKPPVSAGSYKQSRDPTAGSVTITFGDLYIQEVRTVLVDIDIPRADMEGATDVLAISFSYKFGGELEEAPPSFVSVNRLEGLTDEELLAPPEVRAEEVRLLIAKLIKQATDNADTNDLASAQQNLSEGLETLENQDVEQLKATLSNELNELKRLMKTKEIYDKEGRPFANSLLISLATQRQAARGEDISQFQLFSTPAMQQLLKEAQESNEISKMDFKPTVRIFCQLNEDYSLSIRNGKVVLAIANPQDPFQHWIKEEVEGGGFTLFNKGTAQAMKRSPNISPVNNQVIEVLLISMPFGSDRDSDAVWTESSEGGSTFVTVFGKHGNRQGFRLQPHSRLDYDGNTVLLTNQGIGTYQKWKFVPYFEDRIVCPKTIKIYCRQNSNYNLTILDDTVVFAQCDRADPYQHWRKEFTYCQHLKDELGFRAFAIVNVATGKAIQHGISQGYGYPVSLIPFNPMQLEESLLWTESEDQGSGFKKIKVRKNIGVGFDALFDREWMQSGLQEGMRLRVWADTSTKTHEWKMEEFF